MRPIHNKLFIYIYAQLKPKRELYYIRRYARQNFTIPSDYLLTYGDYGAGGVRKKWGGGKEPEGKNKGWNGKCIYGRLVGSVGRIAASLDLGAKIKGRGGVKGEEGDMYKRTKIPMMAPPNARAFSVYMYRRIITTACIVVMLTPHYAS